MRTQSPLPSQPLLITELPHQFNSISEICSAKKMTMALMAMAHEKAADVTKLYC
jgi:hypothetical protein